MHQTKIMFLLPTARCHQGQNKKGDYKNQDEIKQEDIESKVQCDYCPKFFNAEGFVKRHIALCHPDKG